MRTIKICRISGEFFDGDECISYLQPHTGHCPLTWFTFKRGKKIFDSLTYESLLVDSGAEEFFRTKEEMEYEIALNFQEGYKPNIILFTYEISEYVWRNKERLALERGYEDDIWGFISDYTNYDWEDEEVKEIEIPKNVLEFYDCYTWIQENIAELQIKYMQFLVETGGDDEITENGFYMIMARKFRDIIDL